MTISKLNAQQMLKIITIALITTLMTGNILTSLIASICITFIINAKSNKEKGFSFLVGALGLIVPMLYQNFIFSAITFFLSFILLLVFKKKQFNSAYLSVNMGFSIATVLIIEALQTNFANALQIIFFCPGKLIGAHIGLTTGILIILSVKLLFDAVINQRASAFITLGIFSVLGIVNFFVMSLTSQPFLPSDILLATTAMGVVDAQKLSTPQTYRLIVCVLAIICLTVMCVIFVKKYYTHVFEPKRVMRILRSIIACSITVPLLLFLISTSNEYQSKMTQTRFYGFVTNFAMNIKYQVNIPNDAEEYIIADKDYDTEFSDGDFAPNVIIIMNEAFSDLEQSVGLKVNQDPIPYFHSLQQQYPSGTTYASIFANNTVSSEWEVLSGVSTALTTKGGIVYQSFVRPMDTLVSTFNNRGYKTYSLHPYNGEGYNRKNMYKMFGFDTSIFQENITTDSEDYVRNYISDERNYEELIKLFENKGDAPAFIFNITMQNHGGYGEKNNTEYHAANISSSGYVNEYLELLHESDEALKTLIEYFEKVDEPTIILFFGDHQPNINISVYEELFGKSISELSDDELAQMYEVPYLIWSNYEIKSGAAPKITSTNYLSSVLFDVGNITPTTWISRLNEYRKEWPVISAFKIIDKNSNSYNPQIFSKLDDEKYDILLKYKKSSYAVLIKNK